MTTAPSTTRRVRQSAAESAALQTEALTGGPACPKCGGPMWDNRNSKRNPRAPDFRCRNRVCDGVLWPGQYRPAASLTRPAPAPASANGGNGNGGNGNGKSGSGGNGLSALRRCYLDVTAFVLSDVRDLYDRNGVKWSAGALASVVATLFIAETKPEFWRHGFGSQAGREGL